MKKVILSFLFALSFANGVYAQSAFVQAGKRWHIEELSPKTLMSMNYFTGVDSSYDLYFAEDGSTKVDGKEYMHLTYQDGSYGNGRNLDGQTAALLREDEGKVYLYNEKESRDVLLYDFTLDMNDEFELESADCQTKYRCKVTNVDYKETNGKKLKCITFEYTSENGTSGTFNWTEGTGASTPIYHLSNEEVGGYESLVAYVTIPGSSVLYNRFDMTGFCGQQLVLGKEVAGNDLKDNLNYEFVDEQTLHVYGTMWISGGPDQYVYCMTNARHISLEVTSLREDGSIGAYEVDLYFKGFFQDGTYYIKDSNGEHAVVKETTDIASSVPSMLEGNPEWIYYNGPTWSGDMDEVIRPFLNIEFYRYFLDGEEELNGKKYKKVYSDRVKINYYGEVTEEDYHQYKWGIREEGGKIYADYETCKSKFIYHEIDFYKPTEDGEVVMYDFTLQKGDRIESYGDRAEYVEQNPYIEVSQSGYETIYNGEDRYYYAIWNEKNIAGIGAVNRYLLSPIPHVFVSPTPNITQLDLFIQNGEIVYKAPEEATRDQGAYRPNPFYDISNSVELFMAEKNTAPSPIYDLTGRRLNSLPKSGMYIQGGKVKVAR